MQSRAGRAVGALLGLAAGDALGTTYEFETRDANPPLTEIVGGGPFLLAPGQWTDDTSLALCLADSLLARNGFDARDLSERFLRWYRDGENSATGRCFDIGIQTRQALERFAKTGSTDASTDPAGGGNGSIMRLAPVPIRYHADRPAALDIARAQSRTTHGAPEPIEACALLADIIIDAIETADKTFVLRERSNPEPKVDAVAKGSWRRTRDRIRSTGYVIDTLEAALWSVDRAANFEEAVVLAVNLGGDTDTVGAVTGQIAGALWGRAGIPQRWLDLLAWRERIESLATALFVAGTQRE